MVKDFDTGAPCDLTDVNGTLYFAASRDGRPSRTQLWRSDGTEAGTTLVTRPGIAF